MAVNKVVYGTTVLVDLTEDSVTPDALVEGYTAHGADGAEISGANPYAKAETDATVDEQAELIEQIKTALNGKVAGDGDAPTLQDKTITENGTYTADSGYDGLGAVTVDVPVPDGYVQPSGSLNITANGEYAVTDKESVVVAVPETVPTLQEKTATANGVVVPDAGYDGLSKVTVNVASSGGASGENKIPQIVGGAAGSFTISAAELSGSTEIKLYSFYGNKNITGIDVPVGVTSVGNNAFYQCSNLTSVTLPEGLLTIGNDSFRQIGVTSFTIPSTVTKIGTRGLYNCASLLTLEMLCATPPTIESTTLQNCKKLAQIIVPIGSGDTYKAATNWSTYADLIVEATT